MFPSLPTLTSLPYSQPFKRAALGLFHGKTKLSGNNVPFSKHKTRRTWLPNAHRRALYSEVMGRMVRGVVTARALRCVDKVCWGILSFCVLCCCYCHAKGLVFPPLTPHPTDGRPRQLPSQHETRVVRLGGYAAEGDGTRAEAQE